jgi:hypothetical protein
VIIASRLPEGNDSAYYVYQRLLYTFLTVQNSLAVAIGIDWQDPRSVFVILLVDAATAGWRSGAINPHIYYVYHAIRYIKHLTYPDSISCQTRRLDRAQQQELPKDQEMGESLLRWRYAYIQARLPRSRLRGRTHIGRSFESNQRY